VRIYEDLRVVQTRIGVVQYVVVSLLALLMAAFWYIQVLRGHYYRSLADSNRIRDVPIAAPRGPLLDRRGKILVENRASFNIVLTPEHSSNLDDTIVRLGRVLRVGEAQIRERLARRVQFRPVVVKADATLEDVSALEARRLELPEARVEPVPLRSYPLGPAAAHALGRVGEVTLVQLGSKEFEELDPGTLVGQAGIESAYNRNLMGQDGRRRVVVNSRGLEVAEAERQPPQAGPSLTLTLDADLQRAMERAFNGRAGSAVALDPQTGEILAMTSTPAYDPNQFATGLDPGVWGRLSTDPANPLMNRVIQGQYAPGSLFKVVMATAALEEGVITPQTTFYCPGYLSIYNTIFRCHKASGHGVMDVRKAIAQSCNVFFYNVGVRLEIERIARYAKRMGLGSVTGVDLPHEVGGLIPSPEWKLRTQNTPWYAGETVSVAIGQGQVTVTPMQMARVAAVLATGRLVHPHLVKAAGNATVPPCDESHESPCWRTPDELGLRPETLAVVREGMRLVVAEGTGWRARLPGVDVCGKTGSAQVVAHARLARGGVTEAMQPHGWFICFAPADHPRIAMAVLVEHGVAGGESAAPVAHEILASYFRVGAPPTAEADAGIRDTEGPQ
jgi:penicillin-binding protein 2